MALAAQDSSHASFAQRVHFQPSQQWAAWSRLAHWTQAPTASAGHSATARSNELVRVLLQTLWLRARRHVWFQSTELSPIMAKANETPDRLP